MASNTITDDQLEYEQRLLAMPFLEEDLPFLANFDNHPWVSVDQVLDILEADNSTNSTITAPENFSAPGISYNEPIANFAPLFTAVPRAEPDMGAFNAPEVRADELFAPNLAPRTNPAPSSSPFTTFPAAATPAAAPDMGKFKKSCSVCAVRKIKCEVIPGSDPKHCKHCQEKGFACVFELKKSYSRA